MNEDERALDAVFAALADPTRRDLITRLTSSDATLTELAQTYEMSLQGVAKHVAVLEASGLISKRAEAQRRPVHLEANVLSLMTRWLERREAEAEARYQRLDDVIATLDDTGVPIAMADDTTPDRTSREKAS